MRYIFYAIFFYLLYLLLRFFFSKLINIYRYKGKPQNEKKSGRFYRKKDLNNIEEADFEEIK
ncbi:MAG: hypothetical protein EHM58_08300 [Ignavibacteriae bacterium]|nr:MAG: hypothetical protein EHM58_08300 [Ignavibacteriota bacterium]